MCGKVVDRTALRDIVVTRFMLFLQSMVANFPRICKITWKGIGLNVRTEMVLVNKEPVQIRPADASGRSRQQTIGKNVSRSRQCAFKLHSPPSTLHSRRRSIALLRDW